MVDKSVSPAGTYELISFKIYDYPDKNKFVEIRNLVHVFNIVESIFTGSIEGTAKIYDAVGIFYNFPLRGQEYIEIEYRDYIGIKRTNKFMLYSITNVKKSNDFADNVLEYTINFTSLSKYLSERFSISRCIANGVGNSRSYIPISEQVKVIHNDYYEEANEILVHDTLGPQRIIIPLLSPEESMHFMSRRATSSDFTSNMFRFYENRDRHNFVNVEQLVFENKDSPINKYVYSSNATDVSPKGEVQKMNNIISFDLKETNNTLDIINSGAYYRNVQEIDVLNRQILSQEYDHLSSIGDYIYPSDNISINNSKDFIEKYLNKSVGIFVIKDYPDSDVENKYGLRPQPHYSDLHNKKTSLLNSYASNTFTVTIYGSNRIVAGSIIDIEIPQLKSKDSLDDARSGKVLVQSVNNTFVENTYVQVLDVTTGV